MKTAGAAVTMTDNAYLNGITRLHDRAASYDRNAHLKTTTENDYISLDSAENGLEAGYNYFVSIPDDDRVPLYDGFKFTVTLSKSDSLNTAEIGEIFGNVQDSLLAFLAALDDGTFHLSLIDLEFVPDSAGTFGMTVYVNYSFASGEELPESLPGDTTTVYVTDYDSYSPSGNMCTPNTLAYPQSLAGITGLGSWQSRYFSGSAIMNFSTNTLVSGSKDCSKPGAAIWIRKLGSDGYYAAYGSPSPLFVSNISGLVYNYNISAIPTDQNPYLIKGLGDFSDFVIFWNNPPDVGNYHPDYSGNHIHGLWINNQMIGFYADYLTSIIHGEIPSGYFFKDIHIANTMPLNGDYQQRWFYHIYYGTRRTFNDLNPVDKMDVSTYGSPIIF